MGAIGVFALFVAIGAAQPVLERERTRAVRSDAEAFFVFDTTRSMKASSSVGSETRFERARRMGREMRVVLRDLRVGVASLTDRVLPHLFPTANDQSFLLTLDKTLGIERPASVQRGNGLGSSLQAFSGLPEQGFFADGARRGLLIVFTDAESRPFNTALLRDAYRGSGIQAILIRFGSSSERVYDDGVADQRYRPEDGAEQNAESFVDATGGEAFDENDMDSAIEAARRAAGTGGARAELKAIEPTPLASYAFAAAFVPLVFLLWRRNFR